MMIIKASLVLVFSFVMLGCTKESPVLESKKKGSFSKEVAQLILVSSKDHRIDPLDTYSVITVESDFKPYAMSMYTKESMASLRDRFDKESRPKIRRSHIHKDLKKFYFKKEAHALDFISSFKIGTPYRVGLMGIPSDEYYFWQKSDFFDAEDNIRRGLKRMQECSQKNKRVKDQIECLNGLSNKDYRKYDYWRNFKRVRKAL